MLGCYCQLLLKLYFYLYMCYFCFQGLQKKNIGLKWVNNIWFVLLFCCHTCFHFISWKNQLYLVIKLCSFFHLNEKSGSIILEQASSWYWYQKCLESRERRGKSEYALVITVLSTIWSIFSEFFIFCWLISRAFRRGK